VPPLARHRPLAAQERALLRQAIDAAHRDVLYRQRHTHRPCSGCGQWLHKSEFAWGGRVCRLCQAIEQNGAGA
jgi:hypothetical protein